uniref:Uncharacterized protein n=1 Tax=Sipha flava TaxID=143950 RepID=A0A2S2QQ60_9HEMI
MYIPILRTNVCIHIHIYCMCLSVRACVCVLCDWISYGKRRGSEAAAQTIGKEKIEIPPFVCVSEQHRRAEASLTTTSRWVRVGKSVAVSMTVVSRTTCCHKKKKKHNEIIILQECTRVYTYTYIIIIMLCSRSRRAANRTQDRFVVA